MFLQTAGETVELMANSLSSDDNQLSSSEWGGGTTFFLQMAEVTVELAASVNALPATREARKVSPPEDDGGDEADAVPRPADDADDGAEKVDAIPRPIDAEDDAEPVPGAAVLVPERKLIRVVRERRASWSIFILFGGECLRRRLIFCLCGPRMNPSK